MFNTEKGGYIDEQNRNAYKVWESLEVLRDTVVTVKKSETNIRVHTDAL